MKYYFIRYKGEDFYYYIIQRCNNGCTDLYKRSSLTGEWSHCSNHGYLYKFDLILDQYNVIKEYNDLSELLIDFPELMLF